MTMHLVNVIFSEAMIHMKINDFVNFIVDYPEEYPTMEQREPLYTPVNQQQRFIPQPPSNKVYEESLNKVISDTSPNDNKGTKKAYGQYLLDQVKNCS